ncbi:MAG: hypothetical protein C0518_06500 [Opitutus sp.]|nr:hypothetical protein [Opitutus sp.]
MRWFWRGAALVVAGAAALVIWRNGADSRRWMLEVIAQLREAGPLVFFGAMAVLPSFGFPLLPFALTAGPVFGERYGAGGVIGAAVVAVACNVTLSYLLAAHALRPWAKALLARWGYSDAWMRRDFGWRWVLFVRIAPGLPFFVQSYLLGVMRAPFVRYLVISTVVPGIYLAATILLGDSLWHQRGPEIFWSLGLLAGVGLLFELLRRRRRAIDALEIPCAGPTAAKTAPLFPPAP